MAIKRSDAARDRARRNTRMRFEQWAKNPSCEANTVSAVRNVPMADVARKLELTPSFGQSPFAVTRGDRFERNLFWNEAERLLVALIEADVLPAGSTGFSDFRLAMNGGRRIGSLDQAIAETEDLLRDLARHPADEPESGVIAGATVRIPRGVMLPEAVLIIDALVVRADENPPRLVVGEVKTYPDRGGHTDPGELATARAQAGLYVHALEVVLDGLGLADRIVVDHRGFLVLSKPGSNRPSIRAGEDLRYQAERARRGFELLESAAAALPPTYWGDDETQTEDELVEAVTAAPTAYTEGCSSFCDLAPHCFRTALDAGDPVVIGEDVRRFLGGITLTRAMELLDGAAPRDATEDDLLRRIVESDAMAGPS